PILGAHVYVVDPATQLSVVGAYTRDDGTYELPGLAPGKWLLPRQTPRAAPPAARGGGAGAGAPAGGIDVVTNTLTLPAASVALPAGFSLFAWPVSVPAETTAFDLLGALGWATEVRG